MEKKYFGQIGKLKNDMIQEYCQLHKNVWPGVLKMIGDCNIRNYSIFICGNRVFSYFEYVGAHYEEDMSRMSADSVTQEWWKRTHPCFETYAIDETSEFYHDMEQIFHYE